MTIKNQIRSVSELLTAVAPSSVVATVFIANEAVLLAHCERQSKLEGNATRAGGNFGTFTVSKIVRSVALFTIAEQALIVALWATAVAGRKVGGFKF
jgi:hypothetical protein